jgi:hypothetical protein
MSLDNRDPRRHYEEKGTQVELCSYIALSNVRGPKGRRQLTSKTHSRDSCIDYKFSYRPDFHQSTNQISGVVAEWLSRKTRNLVPSGA